ncbi:MAG TPA: hypothetical protein DEH78_27265 [Solibacterales bacterium]|nr:hypothetical protein [Bryobacterales bacterium]
MEGYDDLPLPADYQRKAEFVFGRLMYPGRRGGRGGMGGGDWRQGRASWTVDYPKGDRFFAAALRRLTRIDVRSVEQPINPDDGDDIFNWPFLYVGMPSAWDLTDEQAARIREYLRRGGFLVCDSFFGTEEWAAFKAGMDKILPGRAVIEIPDDDPIFHVVYDLDERGQVGNFRSMLRDASKPYRADGMVASWRGIRDEKGRVVVAMAFNSDLGDSWQLADDPRYPEKYSALGLRVGVNYVLYAMTH